MASRIRAVIEGYSAALVLIACCSSGVTRMFSWDIQKYYLHSIPQCQAKITKGKRLSEDLRLFLKICFCVTNWIKVT